MAVDAEGPPGGTPVDTAEPEAPPTEPVTPAEPSPPPSPKAVGGGPVTAASTLVGAGVVAALSTPGEASEVAGVVELIKSDHACRSYALAICACNKGLDWIHGFGSLGLDS